MRQEGVAVGQVGVGVERNGGHVELAGEGAAIQRLDVGQLVLVVPVARVHLPRGERVEHERIVGVRAVRDPDVRHRYRPAPAGTRRSASSRISWSIVVCSPYSGRLFARSDW